MSLALKKSSSTSGSASRAQKDIGATRLPQVNLLPTDVTEARNLKKLKVVLAGALVVVLVAVAALTFIASTQVTTAQERLDAANGETTRLQTEQRKYAEVPVVLGKIDATEQALFRAGMGDVRWTPVLDAITAELPEDVEIRKLVIEGWDAAQGSITLNDPSQVEGLHSRVSLEFVSATRPDAAELLRSLEALPTFESARISSIEAIEGEGDDVQYTAIASVTLNALALSGATFPEEAR